MWVPAAAAAVKSCTVLSKHSRLMNAYTCRRKEQAATAWPRCLFDLVIINQAGDNPSSKLDTNVGIPTCIYSFMPRDASRAKDRSCACSLVDKLIRKGRGRRTGCGSRTP